MKSDLDDITTRVLLFLRRMTGRTPGVDERLKDLIADWQASSAFFLDQLSTAGELLPYRVLIGLDELHPAATVGDLTRVVGASIWNQEAAREHDDSSLHLDETGFRYQSKGDGFITVPVWFATDRAPNPNKWLNEYFGPERSDGKLSYGVIDVTIPNNHKIGQLEAPSIWRFQFRDDPTKHVTLAGVVDLAEADFFQDLRTNLRNSPERQAFVFIHGYNVTFRDAARRAGQIARDLAFAGTPILYSWPSQGTVKSYPVDATNAQWTVTHLESFLSQVVRRSGANVVHVIAHSMGNLALIYAIQRLASYEPIFNEVALTAPDIDAATFKELAHKIRAVARRVTLYASSRDRALWLSKKFNGHPRAGDASEIVQVAGIDSIDASLLNTDILGHSYFGSSRTVLSDIHYVVRGIDVSHRAGMVRSSPDGYWSFRP